MKMNCWLLNFSFFTILTNLELLKSCRGGAAAVNCCLGMSIFFLHHYLKMHFINESHMTRKVRRWIVEFKNNRITEFQSWKCPCNLHESRSYWNGNLTLNLPSQHPSFIHLWLRINPGICWPLYKYIAINDSVCWMNEIHFIM